MTSLLVTLLYFLPSGRAAAALLRLPLPASAVERLAACFVYGIATNGLLLYLLAVARVPLQPVTYALLPCAALLILLSNRWSPLGLEGERPPRWAAAMVLAIPAAALLIGAAILPMRDWDGRTMWLMKARAIAWEGSIEGRFFQGTLGTNLHNHYPLLMPLDAAAVMRLTGDLENEAVRWIYPLFALSGLLFVRALLSRHGAAAGWVAAAIACLPCFAAVEAGALSAYNDLPLAFLTGIPLLLLMSAERTAGEVRAAGLLLAAAVLCKSEGIAVAGAVLGAVAILRTVEWWRTGRAGAWRPLPLTLVLPSAVAAGLLVLWRMRVPQAHDERYDRLLPTIFDSLGKVPEVVLAFAERAFTPHVWGLFWPATVVLLIVALRGASRARVALPLLQMGLILPLYVAVITVTTWTLRDMKNITVDRLLMHLLVPAATILVIGIETLAARRVMSAEEPPVEGAAAVRNRAQRR